MVAPREKARCVRRLADWVVDDRQACNGAGDVLVDGLPGLVTARLVSCPAFGGGRQRHDVGLFGGAGAEDDAGGAGEEVGAESAQIPRLVEPDVGRFERVGVGAAAEPTEVASEGRVGEHEPEPATVLEVALDGASDEQPGEILGEWRLRRRATARGALRVHGRAGGSGVGPSQTITTAPTGASSGCHPQQGVLYLAPAAWP